MVKHIYPLLIFLSFTLQLISQEANISAKFSQDGNLYPTEKKTSEPIAEFKENQKCIVTAYLGNYTYKVKLKDIVGYVNDQYLFVNEQMMDLYFDHEEKQREKAIQARKLRQEKAEAIARKAQEKFDLIEKNRLDSIAKIEAEAQRKLLEIKRNDSIAKAKETQRLQRIEQAKKDSIAQAVKEQNRLLEEKRINDSIANAKKEARKKRNDSIAKAEQALKTQRIAQRKKDSLARAVKEQNRLLEEKRINDSIANAKKEARKKLELKKRNDSIAKAEQALKTQRIAQRKKDSLAQAVKEQNRLLEEKRINDSIKLAALAQEKALELLKKRNDSVVKANKEALAKNRTNNALKAEQQKLHLEKQRYDSIVKVREQEAKQLQELKRQNDSIAKIIEQERKALEDLRKNKVIAQENKTLTVNAEEEKKKEALLERKKFRDSCHYQINEYDRFYNITTIRTEPYSLSNNLTVELYKQSRKENVFFNYTGDLGCASYLPNQRSSVKVTLENNRTIAFYHSWDIECGDTFLFKARLTNTQIEILKSSPIKSIVLRGTQGYKEINFIDYKEFFIDKLKCIE